VVVKKSVKAYFTLGEIYLAEESLLIISFFTFSSDKNAIKVELNFKAYSSLARFSQNLTSF
jgi:hypothetical protein